MTLTPRALDPRSNPAAGNPQLGRPHPSTRSTRCGAGGSSAAPPKANLARCWCLPRPFLWPPHLWPDKYRRLPSNWRFQRKWPTPIRRQRAGSATKRNRPLVEPIRDQEGTTTENGQSHEGLTALVSRCSATSDPGGARTHDLLIKSQLLCQLSYRVAEILTGRARSIYILAGASFP